MSSERDLAIARAVAADHRAGKLTPMETIIADVDKQLGADLATGGPEVRAPDEAACSAFAPPLSPRAALIAAVRAAQRAIRPEDQWRNKTDDECLALVPAEARRVLLDDVTKAMEWLPDIALVRGEAKREERARAVEIINALLDSIVLVHGSMAAPSAMDKARAYCADGVEP
jgi:hypothetical protein